jgi:hypothetical protein
MVEKVNHQTTGEIMIPPPLTIFAAKYGLKILAALTVIFLLYYTYHTIDKGGFDRATALYEARDAKDAIKAAGILAAAQKSVADKAKENDNILRGVLTHNDQQIKNLITERDAAIARSVFVTTKANADRRDSVPGKTGVQQGDDRGREETCDGELAEDNKRQLINAEYQIARLADLQTGVWQRLQTDPKP